MQIKALAVLTAIASVVRLSCFNLLLPEDDAFESWCISTLVRGTQPISSRGHFNLPQCHYLNQSHGAGGTDLQHRNLHNMF